MKMSLINPATNKKSVEPFDHFFNKTIDEFLSDSFSFSTHIDDRIEEDDKNYILQLPVPGLSKKDLSISMVNGVLKIMGAGEKQRDKRWWGKGTSYSTASIYRTFVLPNDAHPEKIKAKLKNGLLRITIGKLPSQAKAIEVTGTRTENSQQVLAKPVHAMKKWLKNL